LTDFTVFFEEDFFAAAFFATAFLAEAFFADAFLAGDFFGRFAALPRLADADERREDDLTLVFFELLFLLAALVDFFAAAFFAGIARASEGLNETGDYT
jgi:hypothetical protein